MRAMPRRSSGLLHRRAGAQIERAAGGRLFPDEPRRRTGLFVLFQQSSFATFAIAPAKDVVKLRADAPVELLGPLGCGLQTGAGAVLNVMQPRAGQGIAIYGVGGV